MRYTCDDSNSNSSEFGSEDEEVEYGLYARLYFEPNPDVTVNATSEGLAEIQSEANNFHKISQKEVEKRYFVNIKKSETEFRKEINESGSQDHTSAYSDLEKSNDCSSRTNFRVFDGGTSALNDTNEEIRGDCAQKPELCQFPSTLSEECITSKEAHAPQKRRREKLSSICSDGSIPGSIPLDGLYCNMLLTDDEEEEDISSRLTILDKDKLGQKIGDQTQNNFKKRKRDNGADSSGDEQESRCDSLVCTVSKDTRITGSNECILIDESDSDSEVYVLSPSSPKQHEIFTLDSSSDYELVLTQKGKMSSTNETRIEKNNPALPAQRTHTVSPKPGSEKSESLKKLSSSMMNERKKKKRKFGADVDTRSKHNVVTVMESDTDSDFDTCMRTGTDLTINIDKQLSVLVEKLTKGDTSGISRSVSGFGKNQGGSKTSHSFDFTLGRPDTRKWPTCDHWTQEMANFYDSDVSEDLDIQTIHKQQSNARADWQIIKADYQVIHNRRYFGKEDRCTLCRQFGHKQKDCDRVPRCHLCSGTDHRVRHNCPENCCFRCGGMAHVFCPDTAASVICSLCGYQGHRSELCPDLWRRFHLTTSGLRACTPLEPTTRPLMERFCYNCGQRGHFGHDCPTKHEHRSYRQVPQSIISYSSPVLLVNGTFIVNTERAQNMIPDILKIPVKHEEVGKLIGRKGVTVKEIQRLSGADIRIVTNEGRSEVCMYGNSEAKSTAQDMVEILLGHKPVLGYEDFFTHISRINNQELNLKPDGITMSPYTFPKENNGSAYDQITSSDWSINFLNKLGRNKKTVLKNLRKSIRGLDLNTGTIDQSVSQLKKYQEMLKRDPSGASRRRIARLNLKKVARVVIGRERYGPGKHIYEHLQKLRLDIKSSRRSKVPEQVCQNIVHTLAQVHDPPMEKLDEILKYASQYQNSCLESLKNIETVSHNDGIESKKGSEKNWQSSKLQKKKVDQNEDIISEDMTATQKGKGNKLQFNKAGKNVKQIIPQKDDTKKTGEETKKKKKKRGKKQCKMCKKITQQCNKCLKQKLLKDFSPNILHPHKQVDASQLKKVNKAETSKTGENGQRIKTVKSKGNRSQKVKVSKKVKERVIKNANTEPCRKGTKKKCLLKKKIPENCKPNL